MPRLGCSSMDILFAIDRAGLVGEDGPTHAGSFDLSYLRCIPNIIVMTPSDENETRHMLYTGYHFSGPAAVRYPRGKATGCEQDANLQLLEIGKGLVKKQGENFGENYEIVISKKRHQYSNSECGMYSMYFLLQLLQGTPHSTFEKVRVPYSLMLKLRKEYFNSK